MILTYTTPGFDLVRQSLAMHKDGRFVALLVEYDTETNVATCDKAVLRAPVEGEDPVWERGGVEYFTDVILRVKKDDLAPHAEALKVAWLEENFSAEWLAEHFHTPEYILTELLDATPDANVDSVRASHYKGADGALLLKRPGRAAGTELIRADGTLTAVGVRAYGKNSGAITAEELQALQA